MKPITNLSWAGLLCGLLVLLAGWVLWSPLDLSSTGSGDPSSPNGCLPESSLDHRDFAEGAATWVRFCRAYSPGTSELEALVPDTVLVAGADDLVSGWQERTFTGWHSCPGGHIGSTAFAIQVGFADGTVAQLSGDTGGCSASATGGVGVEGAFRMYRDLMRALARQQAKQFRAAADKPVLSCPERLRLDQNVDGASAAITDEGPVLTLPAVDGIICRYERDGTLTDIIRVGGQRAEVLRLTASGDRWHPECCDESAHPPRPDYLVLLRDKTGTTRTFSMTGKHGRVTLARGDPGIAQYVGRSGYDLREVVTGGRTY